MIQLPSDERWNTAAGARGYIPGARRHTRVISGSADAVQMRPERLPGLDAGSEGGAQRRLVLALGEDQ
jgi:hypothetical protein